MLNSMILCGTFRRISQLWDNTHTLNFRNCLLYLMSIMSPFFTLSTAWLLILFLLRDNAHTLRIKRDIFTTDILYHYTRNSVH